MAGCNSDRINRTNRIVERPTGLTVYYEDGLLSVHESIKWRDRSMVPVELASIIEVLQELLLKETSPVLGSITDVPCKCPKCGWEGTVYESEPDVIGDGRLGCPKCLSIVTCEGDGDNTQEPEEPDPDYPDDWDDETEGVPTNVA